MMWKDTHLSAYGLTADKAYQPQGEGNWLQSSEPGLCQGADLRMGLGGGEGVLKNSSTLKVHSGLHNSLKGEVWGGGVLFLELTAQSSWAKASIKEVTKHLMVVLAWLQTSLQCSHQSMADRSQGLQIKKKRPNILWLWETRTTGFTEPRLFGFNSEHHVR